MDNPQRDMTLDEWVGKLLSTHSAVLELKTLREENERLREALNSATKNWEMSAAFVKVRDEENERLKVERANALGAFGTEARRGDALQYQLDQSKNDVAQLARMCNEIVKLRTALEKARSTSQHLLERRNKVGTYKTTSYGVMKQLVATIDEALFPQTKKESNEK